MGIVLAVVSTALAVVAGPVAPASAIGAKSLVSISAGGTFTCGLATDNTIICWGRGTNGELGNGLATNSLTPVEVTTAGTPLAGKTISQVSAGAAHACALATDGTLACWGTRADGRLGNGAITSKNVIPGSPTTAGTPLAGKTITYVDAGGFGTCVVASGAPYCWGGDELGNGSTSTALTPVAVTTAGTPLDGKTVVKVAHAADSTCALTSVGTVACWGGNTAGSLGSGSAGASLVPAALATVGTPLEGKQIAQITRNGVYFHCARTTDSVLACWGESGDGRLGNDNATGDTNVPVRVTTTGTPLQGKTITDIEGGEGHTCAVASDASTACWGWDIDGALGDGSPAGTSSPVPVAVAVTGTALQGKAIQSVTASSSVGHASTCALVVGGTAACWGYNQYGQLGDSSNAASPVAVAVGGLVETAPATAPGTPTGVTAIAGDGQANLLWSAPSNGGSPITGYVVTPYVGVVAQPSSNTGAGTSTTVTGLTNDTTYTFKVAAVNAVGTGSSSSASNAVKPVAAPTVPGVPTAVSAVAGNGQATVQWSAPASNGGSAITGYVVTPSIGGVAQTPVASSGTGTTKVITALANGTAYTFKVAAVNAIGTGSQSAASAAVTPTAPAIPYAPFASWGALVDRLHTDLTTKAPTASARSAWVSQLTAGTKTKGDLADSLRRGSENLSNVDPVVRVYRAFLGRAPDAGGLKFWIARKRNVAPAKTWSVTQIATDFTKSNEFISKYGSLTNRQFVTRIYTDVLGRTADTAGVNYWTGKIDSKQKTKAQVMVGFSESGEYKTKQAQNTDVAVASIYLLGRAPSTAEATDWVTRQKAGTTHVALLNELLDSGKYATHITG